MAHRGVLPRLGSRGRPAGDARAASNEDRVGPGGLSTARVATGPSELVGMTEDAHRRRLAPRSVR